MTKLNLQFLGTPIIKIDDQPVNISRRKGIGLLAYLTVTRQNHTRDLLASLFWPEATQDRARAGLRQALWQLNKVLGKSWIEKEGETLTLCIDEDTMVDVYHFQALLAAGQTHGHSSEQACADCYPLLTEAVQLYRDAFLTGFSLPDNASFDAWQLLQEENFRRKATDALRKLTNYLIETADFQAAIPYAQRWSVVDPLNDTPHHRLMQLYLWTDQRVTAVHQYQRYAQMLQQQLGLEPQEDMRTLYQRIRQEKNESKTRKTLVNQMTNLAATAIPSQTAQAPSQHPLTPPGEIRLTTVLVAGMHQTSNTSWSVQAEKMMENTQNLLQIVTQVVTQYEGQIVHFDGYSVQAILGMLQVHEDDAERAIRAAFEIRSMAQKQDIDLSVGIDTGHIYLGPLHSARFQDVATLGPVIRLATRLQDSAEPNKILVSESTHLFAQQMFEFSPHQPNIRGIDQANKVYEVKQVLAYPQKIYGIKGLRAALIGRDEELQKLKGAFTAVLTGQGQLISLVGDAGFGKSRLIEELKQIVLTTTPYDTAAPLWLESRCLDFRTSTGFWPFIDLLQRFLFTKFNASDETERVQALAACLETLCLQGQFEGNETRTGQIKTLLSNMLTLKLEPEWRDWLRGLDSQTLQVQTFHAVHDFLTALSHERPIILVFENLHWMDDLSFDLISFLIDALRSHPILMICVYRPHYRHQELRLSAIASRKCPERYNTLKLQELTPGQSRLLLKSLLSLDELPVTLEQLVLKQTEGVPFFIEEVVRELIENGLLYAEANQASSGTGWQVRDDLVQTVAVPKSIQRVILSRIDRLDAESKQLLRAAAVVGYNFQTPILSQIMPHLVDLKQALWQLEESALIFREKVFPLEEFVFKHVLIQETIYQTVPPDQKAALHQRVAEAIEKQFAHNLSEQYEQLAYHYDRSRSVEKAIQYLCLAGEKSRQIFLNKEAIRYFTQALERIEKPSAEAAQRLHHDHWQRVALTGLGRTYHRLGQEEQAQAYLQQAIALSEESEVDAPTLIRLYHWLGEVFYWQAQYEEREKVGRKGLALLPSEETESVEAALVYQLLAISAFNVGDPEQFYVWTDKTAQFIEKLPYLEELRPAYMHIAISAYYRKRLDQAAQWLQTVTGWAEQHSDQITLAELFEIRWSFAIQMGDLQAAETEVKQVVALHHAQGRDRRIWYLLQDIIWLYIHLGDFSAAEQYAQRGLEMAETLVLDKYRSVSLLYDGFVKLCRQNWSEAINVLHAVIQSTTDVYWWTEWIAHYFLGQLYRLRHQPEAALDHFQKGMALFRPLSVPVAGWGNRWPLFAGLLTGLETMYEATEGDNAGFKRYCEAFELPQQSSYMPVPKQWFLEPVLADGVQIRGETAVSDSFASQLDGEWTWHDPLGDCAFTVSSGLQMEANNGRDIWQLNLSAPRLLRPIAGEFVAQTVCRPVAAESPKPAIGGLLLWKDKFNFLRLVWGSRGLREFSFDGCLDNQTIVIGRGLVPQNSVTDRVFMRLTRKADTVQAFCSPDGEAWFSLGQIPFPAATSLQIGLHAVGEIDRLIYPDSYLEGTAVRFESFSLWA